MELLTKITEVFKAKKQELTAPTIAYDLNMVDKVDAVEKALEAMRNEDLVERDADGHWRLTK